MATLPAGGESTLVEQEEDITVYGDSRSWTISNVRRLQHKLNQYMLEEGIDGDGPYYIAYMTSMVALELARLNDNLERMKPPPV